MRKQILAALLLFVLTGLSACTGATQTCTLVGLIPEQIYLYSYVDGDGHQISDAFQAVGETFSIPDLPTSVDCGSFEVVPVILLP